MNEKPHDHGPDAYPDEDLPEGSVVDGEALTESVHESFDFVVVGSGAAGAVAAHTLAEAGFSVAIVEEGPWVKTRDFGEDVSTAFTKLMRNGATQAIEGRSFVPLLQARCVGGSTVVNSAIAWRTPEDVLDDWSARFGLGDTIRMRDVEPHFEALEKDLNVHPVDDSVLGENNRGFITEAGKQGVAGHAMRRYEKGCKGSGRCLTGCPHAAKQGMSVTYVPMALRRGARIFTSCRVEKIEIENGRAVGVVARPALGYGRKSSHVVRVSAKHGVFVAASTIQTPNILHRSGIRGGALGKHFQAHPALGLTALFDKEIAMDFGATQGAESTHFRTSRRFKLETISMPPELAAARIPGVGQELVERLAQYRKVAAWAVQIRAEAEGTVKPGWGGDDLVKMTLTENDVSNVRFGSALLAEMFFSAGAREVWPGIYGVPTILRSVDDVKHIREASLDPRAYALIASHLFGAARMGPDKRSSVVGLDFSTHAAKNLYVVDSSIFPTNLGVNPQHTIMAIARLAAVRISSAAQRSRVA